MAEVEEVGNKMQSQMRLHPESEDDDDTDLPLPALFDRASRLHGLASSSALDQEGIRKGVDLLRRCDEMVSKLGLFSPNETKEDVSTANLKYLLVRLPSLPPSLCSVNKFMKQAIHDTVPYYLGEMTEKIAQEDRIPILKSSQDHLKEFIALCEVLELIPEDELELSRQKQPDTMTNRRAQKAWLATISLALCKAFDLLDMLKKEEEMLLAVKERQSKGGNAFAREMLDERTKKAEVWHHNAATRAPYSKPADPITCATFAQDVIEGRASVSQAHEHKHQPLIFGPASLVGGGLTSERERMAAQVFQPGYSFEVLAYDPVEHWCWDPLPPPPFFEDPEYEAPVEAPFAVVGGGTRICVSTTTATYCFDTVTDEWGKVGDWVLPFRAELVRPRAGPLARVSIRRRWPYDLCTMDDLSTDEGSSPPTVRHIGNEFELPESWWEVTSDLVSLGSRRFCIASSFMVDNEQDECDSVPVAVFTGVEVLPGERGIRMVKHKSECFILLFRFVL
ncbi:PP2A regulatory subunit TAP46 [Dichanthelium oligosanthes]|uniref:PP2A regulatory subunit TAP46 n=1 Tax=Dichanthelium oligosanthes TaxID=888268 RepID=A0A1E5WC08_9POAL|nr:PP2A regulatory subunit TAP46 [Dichanthelium oligosanthes]